MIIGYLALGLLGAVLSSGWALLSGYGLGAAFGFYILGGGLTTMVAICAALYARPVAQTDMARA